MDFASREQLSSEASDRFCFVRFLLREAVVVVSALGMGASTGTKHLGASVDGHVRQLQGERANG